MLFGVKQVIVWKWLIWRKCLMWENFLVLWLFVLSWNKITGVFFPPEEKEEIFLFQCVIQTSLWLTVEFYSKRFLQFDPPPKKNKLSFARKFNSYIDIESVLDLATVLDSNDHIFHVKLKEKYKCYCWFFLFVSLCEPKFSSFYIFSKISNWCWLIFDFFLICILCFSLLLKSCSNLLSISEILQNVLCPWDQNVFYWILKTILVTYLHLLYHYFNYQWFRFCFNYSQINHD